MFSPVESRVAVVTGQQLLYNGAMWGPERIRIFTAPAGRFVRELWVRDVVVPERVNHLAWSADGSFVFASYAAGAGASDDRVGVWDLRTGRHRADLGGAVAAIAGLMALPGGREVVAGSEDAHLLVWEPSIPEASVHP